MCRAENPCTELETRAGTWRCDANQMNQHFSPAERTVRGADRDHGFIVIHHNVDIAAESMQCDVDVSSDMFWSELSVLKRGMDGYSVRQGDHSQSPPARRHPTPMPDGPSVSRRSGDGIVAKTSSAVMSERPGLFTTSSA
jgi:hypothetical protein